MVKASRVEIEVVISAVNVLHFLPYFRSCRRVFKRLYHAVNSVFNEIFGRYTNIQVCHIGVIGVLVSGYLHSGGVGLVNKPCGLLGRSPVGSACDLMMGYPDRHSRPSSDLQRFFYGFHNMSRLASHMCGVESAVFLHNGRQLGKLVYIGVAAGGVNKSGA